jgi:hypothetical protein
VDGHIHPPTPGNRRVENNRDLFSVVFEFRRTPLAGHGNTFESNGVKHHPVGFFRHGFQGGGTGSAQGFFVQVQLEVQSNVLGVKRAVRGVSGFGPLDREPAIGRACARPASHLLFKHKILRG